MIEGFTGETVGVPYAGVEFRVDPSRGQDPAWFGLGVRKSGSSMFNRALMLMAKFNKVNWIDIAGDLFTANVPATRWSTMAPPPGLLAGGNLYGGFRNLPAGIAAAPEFRAGVKVLLVRDPRDAVVSEYFSNRSTHSLPEGEGDDGARAELLRRRAEAQAEEIVAFARRQTPHMAETIEDFLPLVDDPRLLLLRYEDIIFDKPKMIRDTIAHFGWAITQDQIDRILKWIDVVPDAEDDTKFIRKVTPGDHRDKLPPEVIAEMDARFARIMEAFGYR